MSLPRNPKLLGTIVLSVVFFILLAAAPARTADSGAPWLF